MMDLLESCPGYLYDRNDLWELVAGKRRDLKDGIGLNMNNDLVFASVLRLNPPENRMAALAALPDERRARIIKLLASDKTEADVNTGSGI